METNENEPLMTCRKRSDDVKTEGESLTRDKFGGRPVDCPSGIRHREGVNLTQAFVWNVGTCRLDDKGETQAETLQESEYRCEAQGRMTP